MHATAATCVFVCYCFVFLRWCFAFINLLCYRGYPLVGSLGSAVATPRVTPRLGHRTPRQTPMMQRKQQGIPIIL